MMATRQRVVLLFGYYSVSTNCCQTLMMSLSGFLDNACRTLPSYRCHWRKRPDTICTGASILFRSRLAWRSPY